jgi:hypothetical protein
MAAIREFFRFPNPVNESAARVTAGGVLLMAAVLLLTRQPLLLWPLAYGFVARSLAGPRISPLARLATQVIAPRLPVRYTPGPPKRFAQSLGAAMTVCGLLLTFALGLSGAAYVVAGLLVLLAGMESLFGFCLGCRLFSLLIAARLLPPTVCLECADIRQRPRGTKSEVRAPLGVSGGGDLR